MVALHQRVLQLFRESGLRAGDSIATEQELSAELGVSRSALREALAVLEAFGVVVARQGARRTFGSFDSSVLMSEILQLLPPTTHDLRELLDVRRVLEVAFFPIAVADMPPRKIHELRQITNRMEAKAARGIDFVDEDALFHSAIYAHLGNKTLEGLLTSFWRMFEASSNETKTGRDLPASALSHARIVDGLEAGDTALAVHQLNVHFFDVRARLLSQDESIKPDTSNAI